MRAKIALTLLCLLSCGFGLFHRNKPKPEEQAATSKETPPDPRGGYALLYKLLSDEKDVSKLLIIKKETSELHELIKAIADRSKRAYNVLTDEGKHDKTLDLKNQELPAIELGTRERISKEKGKQLLHAKAQNLELLLLLSQNEALGYGSNLSAVLASSEPGQQRREFLQSLSEDFAALQERVLKMLLDHYR